MHAATVAFSSHRPETLPFAARQMEAHDVILLEEPPTDGFQAMLTGTLPVADYLMGTDMEFPAFDDGLCRLLRRLHRKGRRILQVEPYLERLVGIHERFAAGETPADIPRGTRSFQVYEAEKRATGALIGFYETAISGTFEACIESVKAFARADAMRLRLRDALRADALAPLILNARSAYVEAGFIHYALWGALRQALAGRAVVRTLFVMADVVRSLRGRRHTLGPGDVLTLLYVFHPRLGGTRLDLLAARSLVFAKLLKKEEMPPGDNLYPHTKDEVETIRVTQGLSFHDCARLFSRIRLASTTQARSTTMDYLREKRTAVSKGAE